MYAELNVAVGAPTPTGSQARIELKLQNSFTNSIEGARAVIFLMDDKGKVVGHDTKWVIGGTKENPPLAPNASTSFNFVVPTEKPFTKTKVSVTKVILQGGKVLQGGAGVHIEQAPSPAKK